MLNLALVLLYLGEKEFLVDIFGTLSAGVHKPDEEDQFDEEVEYYLQTGYMRDPCLKGPGGQKLWLFIRSEIQKCEPKLDWDTRVEEYELMSSKNRGLSF